MSGFLGGRFGFLWALWCNLRNLWVLGMVQNSSTTAAVPAKPLISACFQNSILIPYKESLIPYKESRFLIRNQNRVFVNKQKSTVRGHRIGSGAILDHTQHP